MTTLYHYKRTRRQQAIKIALNILILPLLLYIFEYIAKDTSNFKEMYLLAEKIALSISVILIVIFIWFLRSKEKFEIYVTESEFYSYHPLFKEWCFSVSPKDIKSIKNNSGYTSGHIFTNIHMYLHSGVIYQICQNYSFSRKKLYGALKSVNPNIELPENFYVFKNQSSKDMDF